MKNIILFSLLIVSQSFSQSISFSTHNIQLDERVKLNDFILEDYSTTYWNVYIKVTNESNSYLQWVRIEYNLYNQGTLLKHEYEYINYDTYENSGLVPYSIGLVSALLEKANFDSINFSIDYSVDAMSMLFLNNSALELISSSFNNLTYTDLFDEWVGEVKNNSDTPIYYPNIFVCFYKRMELVKLDYTFLDVSNNILNPHEIGHFSGLVSKPIEYDSVEYYLHYSIGLTGEFINSSLVQTHDISSYLFALAQNYPNPFNAETTVNFQIYQPDNYEMNIYDANGCLVKKVLDNFYQIGHYQIDINLSDKPSGIYFCILKSNYQVLTKSMVFIK